MNESEELATKIDAVVVAAQKLVAHVRDNSRLHITEVNLIKAVDALADGQGSDAV